MRAIGGKSNTQSGGCRHLQESARKSLSKVGREIPGRDVEAGAVTMRLGGQGRSVTRESNREDASLAGDVRDGKRSALRLHAVPGNRQPDPKT